jgi:hypothetical protein
MKIIFKITEHYSQRTHNKLKTTHSLRRAGVDCVKQYLLVLRYQYKV